MSCCEKCGREAPTALVEFNQNIGAVIIRFAKTSRGKYCRRCIDETFKNFTLITLLVGWFGLISLFITPIFILGNILEYMNVRNLADAPPDPAAASVRTFGGYPQPQKFSQPNPYTKFIIAGVVMFVMIVLFAGAAFVWAVATLVAKDLENEKRCLAHRNELEINPQPFDKAKAYLNDRMAGTGFLVKYADKLFAVTAGHPFKDGDLPETFMTDALEGRVALGPKLQSENDVLVFNAYVPEKVVVQPLAYDPDIIVKSTDAVAILCPDGIHKGKVLSLSNRTVTYSSNVTVIMDQPFAAQGCSGSAVILVSTGTVIGVLETANDANRAKRIGFHMLDLSGLKEKAVVKPIEK